MEAAAGGSAAAQNGGVSMPSSFQGSRKEWRVVSGQSVRNSSNEELEYSKLGQSDERLVNEMQHGGVPVDFINGGLDNDLRQRLHTVAKQREGLQQMEIELRAQFLIAAMQNSFDSQMKEHANTNVKLQEQLHEKGQKILELERKMDKKEQELHAIRLDNQAAWAKEDLLREQSKELQSYRRERENSEAERAQHVKQIQDLQEHLQEKEQQFMELQEQHRIAQESILYKDQQIGEAQAWITRAREMDAFHSTTNHTLQAELLERTEQYNQLWLGCQGQFAEMERLHLHIQQLQLELAGIKENSGSNSEGSPVTQTNLKDASELGQGYGTQVEVDRNNSGAKSGSLQNGNSESASSFAHRGDTSTQIDQVHGVVIAPTSLLGMPTYLSTGQGTAVHPFVVHQQGIPHPSQVPQSHFQYVPAVSSIQSMLNEQGLPDGERVPESDQYPLQAEQSLLRTDSCYDHDASVNSQVLHANYLDTNISRGLDADAVSPLPNGEVIDSVDKSFDNVQSPPGKDPLGHGNGSKLKKGGTVVDQVPDTKNMLKNSNVSVNSSEEPTHAVNVGERTSNTTSSAVLNSVFVSSRQKNSTAEDSPDTYLLDERTLLAAIARTIGSGCKIRISSTLPNRLAKMLAPLHWNDYKKKYGKLEDFVSSHPELFLIDGDYIHLREGAQGIIAAKAAVAAAAVAAAAAAPSSSSSLLPSVSVTPMAQFHRLQKVSSLESSSMNGGSLHVAGGVSNVKILSKPKDHTELHSSVTRPYHPSLTIVGNGTKPDKSDFSHSIGAANGRPRVSLVGKHQSRTMGAGSNPRR